MPATARIANTVIAEADDYETVEGNIYFPPSSIKDKSMLEASSLTTVCPWKGTASYYTLKVDGQSYKDAAWYYPQPKEKAQNIKDYVAFCESICPFVSRKRRARGAWMLTTDWHRQDEGGRLH